jgi:hypothetical protein
VIRIASLSCGRPMADPARNQCLTRLKSISMLNLYNLSRPRRARVPSSTLSFVVGRPRQAGSGLK